jgi:type VI secretion system protein ImpA
MTPEEIAALSAPLPGDEPCGPDLEMLGDPDFMRFTARIEGLLPRSFASFDRNTIDFPAELATLKSLLEKSRDLRLLTPLAKLLILNRDVAAYAAVLKLIETLMESAWPAVLPGLLDGDAVMRIVTLQTLDDMADSVMPLQAAPLFETRRFGKFSYRSQLLASGKVQPRESQNGESSEEVPTPSAVGAALTDIDLGALVAVRDRVAGLRDSLGRIEALVNEKSGQDGALRFDRLGPLVKEIAGFLDQSVAARDPSLASTGPAAAAGAAEPEDEAAEAPAGAIGASGAIGTARQAEAALAAAAAYFAQSEPSSPILLLIGQAQALVGRSFFEAMQVLLPDRSSEARLRVGQNPAFMLPLERLAALSVVTTAAPAIDLPHDSTASDEAPADRSDADSSEAENSAGETRETESITSETETQETGAATAETVVSPPAAHVVPGDPAFLAADRRTAMALLQQVAAHYRRAEPSSAIPVLLDRAEGIAGKDFFALLREAFPAGALKIEEQSSEG